MNETELLFAEIFHCDRASLYLNKDLILGKDKAAVISSVLKRRLEGEPIQYILGKTEFMGFEFKVDRNVFIPRPETEILVEATIKQSYVVSRKSYVTNILDLGTGSGCIAISLAKLLPNAKIAAIDISREALEIARENAGLNNVTIDFIQGDLFNTYDLGLTTYDLIVCNPPYVATGDIDKLEPEIKYEPFIALDGGSDGLGFYRHLINSSAGYLKKGGFLILEVGFGQKESVENIFQESGNFKIIGVVKDYNAIDRVIVAKKSKID